MIKIYWISIIIFFLSCTKINDSNSGELLIYVNGECSVDVILFDTNGSQIARNYYDCNYTNPIIFKPKTRGTYILYAENYNGKKTSKQSIFFENNGSQEITIIL